MRAIRGRRSPRRARRRRPAPRTRRRRALSSRRVRAPGARRDARGADGARERRRERRRESARLSRRPLRTPRKLPASSSSGPRRRLSSGSTSSATAAGTLGAMASAAARATSGSASAARVERPRRPGPTRADRGAARAFPGASTRAAIGRAPARAERDAPPTSQKPTRKPPPPPPRSDASSSFGRVLPSRRNINLFSRRRSRASKRGGLGLLGGAPPADSKARPRSAGSPFRRRFPPPPPPPRSSAPPRRPTSARPRPARRSPARRGPSAATASDGVRRVRRRLRVRLRERRYALAQTPSGAPPTRWRRPRTERRSSSRPGGGARARAPTPR